MVSEKSRICQLDNWLRRNDVFASTCMIVLPVFLEITLLRTVRLFGSTQPALFDRGGLVWIVLVGMYDGGLSGGVIYCLYQLVLDRSNRLKTAATVIVACLLISSLFVSRSEKGSAAFDEVITDIGYEVFVRSEPLVVRDGTVPYGYQTVIPAGTTLIANTKLGEIRLRRDFGLRRKITWDGCDRSVELVSRPSNGNLTDVLASKGNWLGYDFLKHNDVYKCYYVEEFINFDSVAQALSIIYNPDDEYFPFVYTGDGLVVGWSTKTSFHGLQVAVWQVLINGKRPHELPGGCTDDKIRLVKTGA